MSFLLLSPRARSRLRALCTVTLLLAALPMFGATEKIMPKVIVLAGFEVGEDTGDTPGEFQYWAEREHMTGTIRVPGAPQPLRYNDAGLYGCAAGNTRDRFMSTVPASELIRALCLDPRFDLRKTYWLITGIAGIDPAAGSIGSAVWAENVIDGDALREVGEKEMPADWPYGLFAIGTEKPNTLPKAAADAGGWGGATLTYSMNYPLNSSLAHWALEFSRAHAKLDDLSALKAWRDQYTAYPAAQQPPMIAIGGTLSSARYWHGEERTRWARDWVNLWTAGKDHLATTAMEQAAYVGTLQRMSVQGFVDFNRVMMLRGASNYSTPPSGHNVTTTIGDESLGTEPGFEALHRAGSVVAHELLSKWKHYEANTPTP